MNNMDNKCSNERAAIIFQWLSGWQTAAAQIRETGKVDMVAVAKVSTHPDFLLGAMDHYAAMTIPPVDSPGCFKQPGRHSPDLFQQFRQQMRRLHLRSKTL